MKILEKYVIWDEKSLHDPQIIKNERVNFCHGKDSKVGMDYTMSISKKAYNSSYDTIEFLDENCPCLISVPSTTST